MAAAKQQLDVCLRLCTSAPASCFARSRQLHGASTQHCRSACFKARHLHGEVALLLLLQINEHSMWTWRN
jgi:hypothetical protein